MSDQFEPSTSDAAASEYEDEYEEEDDNSDAEAAAVEDENGDAEDDGSKSGEPGIWPQEDITPLLRDEPVKDTIIIKEKVTPKFGRNKTILPKWSPMSNPLMLETLSTVVRPDTVPTVSISSAPRLDEGTGSMPANLSMYDISHYSKTMYKRMLKVMAVGTGEVDLGKRILKEVASKTGAVTLVTETTVLPPSLREYLRATDYHYPCADSDLV